MFHTFILNFLILFHNLIKFYYLITLIVKKKKKIISNCIAMKSRTQSIFQESDGDKSDQDLVVDIANEPVSQ